MQPQTERESYLLAELNAAKRKIKRLQQGKTVRRRTRKEKALDTIIKTPHALHHFYQKDPKTLGYKCSELTQNSKKISFGKISDFWGSLELFAYENNEKYFYIALNGKVRQIDKFDLRKLLSLTMKAGRYLGVLGRKTKKKPKTENQ